MAAFRRSILALAALGTFAGLASAQNTNAMNCTAQPQFPNTVRAEAKTSLLGDVLISCTQGPAFADGTVADRIDLTVTLPNTITSRVDTGTQPVTSEVLLLIDDPASANPGLVPNYGNNAPITVCTTLTAAGCSAFAEASAPYIVMTTANAAPGATTTAANVYQGKVNGTSVTFTGVPVIPPGPSGAARTFRVVNLRMDASAAAAGSVSATYTINDSTGSTGGTALFGAASSGTVSGLGTVATGLSATSTKFTTANGVTNCAALTTGFAGTISFAEGFASAFKTRVIPTAGNTGFNPATTAQSVPGAHSASESGYIMPGAAPASTLTVAGASAGLADFGTRLKAVFSNIPSGAHVFVSFGNVQTANAATGNLGTYNSHFINAGSGATIAANVGDTSTTSFALLVSGENAVTTLGDWTNVEGGAKYHNGASGPIPANFPYVELTVNTTTNSATAVWEVTNDNPNGTETFTFDVFVTVAAQGATGQTTVNQSFAPTTLPSAGAANLIPYFADTSGSGTNAFNVGVCQTTLLFPYVTSALGYDTGIAVSNTGKDVFNTTGAAGTCKLYVYGIKQSDGSAAATGPFDPTDTTGAAFPSTGVPAGQTAVWSVFANDPGVSGYAIAQCSFQYAHGFAFVSNFSSPTQSSAMGYLPLVLGNITARGASPESSQQ
jgi:hypothetical protein